MRFEWNSCYDFVHVRSSHQHKTAAKLSRATIVINSLHDETRDCEINISERDRNIVHEQPPMPSM